MGVVEDFDSRPHKEVSFVLERDKKIQEWREQKMPGPLPGFSGGKLPGRSKAEKGQEEDDAENENQERHMRSEVSKEIVPTMMKEADTVGSDVVKNSGPIHQCTIEQRRRQHWDSSKVEK